MNVTGIIAEYNPFHLGHAWHLEEARRQTGADFRVVVMSGDFMQRGEPAAAGKDLRARMALSCGADLVLELPVPFACGSAEDFAFGAVSLLDRLGVVDRLFFGSESGRMDEILSASRLFDEHPELQAEIRAALREGLSYPAACARAAALAQEDGPGLSALYSSPNNLLAIEYCRALRRLSSSVRPVTVRRRGDYHAETPSASDSSEPGFPSAASLRNAARAAAPKDAANAVRDGVPSSVYALLSGEAGHSFPLDTDDFSDALFYCLLGQTPDSLCAYQDVSPELAARILRFLPSCRKFSELAEAVKCKSYTRLRINRALLHCLLGITSAEMAEYRESGCLFARVLGYRRRALPLLSAVSKAASIPLLYRMSDAKALPETASRLFSRDVFASELWRMTAQRRFNCLLPDEYSRPLIVSE